MPKSLILRALLLGLLVNTPALIEYFSTGGLSPRIFSDWDEVHYLPVALTDVKRLLTQLHNSDFNLSWLIVSIPYHVSEVLFGLIAYFLNIKLSTLGLGMDLIFFPLSFIIISLALYQVSSNKASAQIAALVMLLFPWLGYIGQYLSLPNFLGAEIITTPHNLYPCPPVLRSISSQISYPIVGAALYSLFKAMKTKDNSRKMHSGLLISGALAGFTNYLYFFAWPALAGLSCTLLVISGIYQRNFKSYLCGLISYLSGTLITSALALWALSKSYVHSDIPADATSTTFKIDYWYFSPEQFLLLLIVVGLLFYIKPKNYWPALTIVSSICAEFVLMNTQAIFKSWIVPYHFPLFYLHPIITGCLILILFECLKTKSIHKLATVIPVVAVICVALSGIYKNIQAHSDVEDFIGLANAINTETDNAAKILVLPWDNVLKVNAEEFHVFLMPYWINTLTLRSLYLDPVRTSWEGMYSKELLSRFIYSGEIKPLAPCPETPPELPGDMLQGVMTRDWYVRYNFCQSISRTKKPSLCELIKLGAPQYVVWQHDLISSIPGSIAPNLQSLWKDKSGNLELLKFDSESAIKQHCQEL